MAKTVISKDDLCKVLSSRGYHPVLPFGDTSSGKTSLLLSLLAELHSENVPFRLDNEPLLSQDTGYGKKIHEDTKIFHDIKFPEFINKQVPGLTRIEYPIYVPIIVTNPRTKQEIKLAFLESNGEWYRKVGWNKDEEVLAFHKKEIYDILTKFEKGVMFIYVAPYMDETIVDKPEGDLWHADHAIFAVLSDYISERNGNRDYDSHLFLLNKWDKFRSPYEDKQRNEFVDPNWADVENWLELNYKHSWPKFFSMARITKNKATLMHYSAGKFKKNSDDSDSKNGYLVDVSEKELLPIYKKMRRLIWNWIVKNSDPKFGQLFNDNVR